MFPVPLSSRMFTNFPSRSSNSFTLSSNFYFTLERAVFKGTPLAMETSVREPRSGAANFHLDLPHSLACEAENSLEMKLSTTAKYVEVIWVFCLPWLHSKHLLTLIGLREFPRRQSCHLIPGGFALLRTFELLMDAEGRPKKRSKVNKSWVEPRPEVSLFSKWENSSSRSKSFEELERRISSSNPPTWLLSLDEPETEMKKLFSHSSRSLLSPSTMSRNFLTYNRRECSSQSTLNS